MPAKRGKRPVMGRPPKPEAEVRRNRVPIMVTDGERKALEALADARGEPVSTVAYDLLSRALRRTVRKR